jgi:hypothetical protein
MIRKLSISIGVALLAAGCASGTKRYEQGAELQRAGRPAEAADRYIQALKKDVRLDSARLGLRTVGTTLVADYLRTAADPGTTLSTAADAYLAIDDLTRRAMEVGVYLVTPGDYATRRRGAFDRAIASEIINARQLASGRQYADALSRLAHASTAYQPSSAQTSTLGNVGADVAIAWGRADTLDGRFRSAFSRVEGIPSIPGVTASQANDARSLSAAALARGTRKVAIIPPSATVNARRELPAEALPALGDALTQRPWDNPPRFVSLVLPSALELDLRRLGLGRRTMTAGEASLLGRALGTDYVVITEIDSVRRDDMNVRVTRHPVRTRSGADTAYVTEDGTTRLYARASYVVVDRDGQRVSDYQSVYNSVTAPFTRVRFAGDYRTLDLRQGERDLFDRARSDDELVGAFVGAMSPRLADAVFAEVLRRIP